MALASERYPRIIHHRRWCLNGSIPDAWFIRQVRDGLNHTMAHRRKVFLNVAAPWETLGAAGTTNYWRAYMRTGYGASELRFDLALGLDLHVAGDPYVEVVVTESGGASQTIRIDYGNSGSGSSDEPYTIGTFFRRGVTVSPNTAYEILVRGVDGGRPLTVAGYEYANPEINESTSYYAELAPSVAQPVYDSFRQKLLDGLSNVWKGNGAHLLTWAGLGTGNARSVTGTTWTNVFDGTSTAIDATTPGYYFGSEGGGALSDLLPLVRTKDGNDLPVTLAVYGNSSNSTGEVRIVDSSAVGPSITTIGTTLQWYTTNTTWSNVDAIAGSGKVDLQARHSTAGQTVNVYAVSLLARNA